MKEQVMICCLEANPTQRRSLWLPVAMCLLMWLPTTRAEATYVDDSYRYMVSLSGTNTIKIQAPVYDMEGADCWVTDGNLNVSWDDDSGSHTETAFHWARQGDADNDDDNIYIRFRTDVGGTIDITQGNSASHFSLVKGDGQQERLVYRNNDGNTFCVYAVWRVPYDLQGKKLKFSWNVERDGNSRSKEKVSLEGTEINVPAAAAKVTPQVTAATMAYSEKGKLEMPWFIAATNLTDVHYEYVDHDGKTVILKDSIDSNNRTLYLDATEPHYQFKVVVSYKDRDGNLIENQTSTATNLTMIHAPIALSARPTGNSKASVELKWHTLYPAAEDMFSTDMFEVQRSLTGREADFTSIGSVVFDEKQHDYTFVDSTIVDAITQNMLTGGGTLPHLTYRVRRSVTQNWGWDGNPCATAASCVLDDIHLMRISTYSAKWKNERARSVTLTWDYANEYNGVWDQRAKMRIRVLMSNRDDQVVDSMNIYLTADEIKAKTKVLDFSRSCLKYNIELIVETGTSPLRKYENMEKFYFPIRSADDWKTFTQKITDANGKYDVNGRLFADINVDIYENSKCAYRGAFDGNGHTINVSNSNSKTNAALFSQVCDTVAIRNLHIAGGINVNDKFASGLIGDAQKGAKLLIENCRATVSLKSSIDGDATNGGFVAHTNDSVSILIRNSVFDGSFDGWACHSNGGFVGTAYPYNVITIENSLFAPSGIYTKRDNCDTWARHNPETTELNIMNSYATMMYSLYDDDGNFILYRDSDWDVFAALVKNAAGNSDLNAVMYGNIYGTSVVGGNDYPYRGTFDGRGYRLDVNIDSLENAFTAPFSIVTNATFRNLQVTGVVKGGIHSAGLVGSLKNASVTATFDKIRVSAEVISKGDHLGGLVGHTADGSNNVIVTNCLFDGQLSGPENGENYAGAFLGWGDGNWTFLHNYENAQFYQCPHAAMNYKGGNAWGGDATNYSIHDWGEMASDANRNLTDQASADTLLGDGWKITGGNVMPNMNTMQSLTADALLEALGSRWIKDSQDTTKIVLDVKSFDALADSFPTPQLPDFFYQNLGKVVKPLHAETRQSSVVLTWDTDGNSVDYCEVWRCVKGDTVWTKVAGELTHTAYEDSTVSPVADYIYYVRGVNDCEGITYSYTDTIPGACKHTGRVSGYVRLQDGTGVPGIYVQVVSDTVKVVVKTDATGRFVADNLPYLGKQSITYDVTPLSSGTHPIKLEVESYAATFDSHSNDRTTHEFTVTNSCRFSGFVMYDGTSIPVKGVRFMVNGEQLHNAAGKPVETDFDGSFSFRVLSGKNTIQAIMDDHTFMGEGYYKGKDGYDFTDNVDQIYFYDSTLVKLTGRVVGGNDQGLLPLDNNLSKNNLGDRLTMVLTLEGDNTSWLVYDNLNPERSERKVTFTHPGGNKHETQVTVQRKRMVVNPDSLTGEYVLMLPPVRWKLQQVYCEGYPTLFQDGQVSEVIDLTNCLKPDTVRYNGSYTDSDGRTISQPTEIYNATYSRIYHAPVEITFKQVGYDNFDYFGDKIYAAQNLSNESVEVPLVYSKRKTNWPANNADSLEAHYTFGYPVFSIERTYPIQISVMERYPWNGVKGSVNEDIVRVGGGKVTIHNGMKNGLALDTVRLDSLGQGRYNLRAEQTTRLLTGEDALRTVSMTLEQDGTTYEATPLRGYVMNMFSMTGSKDIITSHEPVLIDILRDPPGSGSNATLSKGSKLKFSYDVDMKFEAGVEIEFGMGEGLNNYSGVVAGAAEYGLIYSADSKNFVDLDVIFNGAGKKAYSYTMNLGEDISTSSDASMVGADADLYMGVVQNIVITPMSTIRAISDKMYKQMTGRVADSLKTNSNWKIVNDKYGSLVHIAEGRDSKDSLYHLVRDQSLGYGPEVVSQFIYSQRYIINELLPNLAQELYAKLFVGSRSEAETLAQQTKQPVYLSKVTAGDENFGTQYEMILPPDTTGFTDEVAQIQKNIMAWVNMIGTNEYEKLYAYDLLGNYDLDGGSKVTYSETFNSEFTKSEYYNYPFTAVDYFGEDGASDKDWAGRLLGSDLSVSPALVTLASIINKKFFGSKATGTSPNTDIPHGNQDQGGEGGEGGEGQGEQNDNRNSTKLEFDGWHFTFDLTPVAEYSSSGAYGSDRSFSRKESFTLALSPKSHMNVDVYKVHTQADTLNKKSEYSNMKADFSDMYRNEVYDSLTTTIIKRIAEGVDNDKIAYSRSFIYRTRGGATCNPWEDERRTLVYRQSSLLDERTKKISNPKISLDRQSVSGVAVGDPACFKVYLTNDSEYPEAATGALMIYNLYLNETSNPNGAKIYVDGSPLNSSGIDLVLRPGDLVQKTIEVYAGNQFDYEGLQLVLTQASDWVHAYDLVNFDVHYLHEAGAVNISTPGDKWTLNTDAEYDEKRGWFLPVIINGFNKHQHNFDHIEFQYKESQRDENYWTNLCSYYADSTLMAAATGVREKIPENGNISTHFYGEGTVIEKAYDLRAVLYCRNGSSFLTTASPVISGVKDTRRPQLFGTPEPVNGIVKLGDNIVFNFSEDIEYNYLNAITNFEVKGEVNNNNVSETVSLQFADKASVETEAQRNFNGKDLTIDMMIKPAESNRDMPLFSHGTNGKKLQLWLTKDFKLKAVVDDQVYTSNDTVAKGLFTQVAMTISRKDSTIAFYNGGTALGSFKLRQLYKGTGQIIFGRTNETNRSKSEYYEGRMMEARLWYRALDGGLIGTTYGNRRLTGYEMGLVDYYPMNEGTGNYALDHTQGANAQLFGASWAMPSGLSLHLDVKDRGLALNQNALNRTKEQDYTLMFWFKTDTDGRGVLLSNGRGYKDEVGAANLFNIAFEAEKLMYRSNGLAVEVAGNWSDGQWHHYAMTVNRLAGVAEIYVDQTLRATFETDKLGGISGGHPLIGAALYDQRDEKGQVTTMDTRNWLTGNIDEICFFEQALPLTLIKSYSAKSPQGDEAGLLTYLSFDKQERQKDNDIELVPYAYSKKIYKNEKGEVCYELDPQTQLPTTTPVRDYSFADSVKIDAVLAHIDATTAAPVVSNEDMKNLKFSFVGKGNQLLVSLDEQAARVNNRNIYVTVRDIEDKNGNAMSSPHTACYYIMNSALQWMNNRLTVTVGYGQGETINLNINNNSAVSHTYSIENCPTWLSLSSSSDVMSAQSSTVIKAQVNKDLNIGTYNEIIYLTDEENNVSPLYLNLTVEGEQPDWAWNVDGDLLKYSMDIIGRVYVNDEVDIDSRDIVGVFDSENKCHGFAHVNNSSLSGENNIYLTAYDDNPGGHKLSFKLWQYSTGRELVLTADGNQTVEFKKSGVLGSDNPVRLEGGTQYVQTFDLKKGWNWVSFNVSNESLFDLSKLLDGLPWQENDILTDMGSDTTLIYTGGHWLASGKVANLRISPKKAYAIMVQKDVKFPVSGSMIRQQDMRTIEVCEGWNAIGYTPMLNLTVQTALSDYYDDAQPGDVIKSQEEFAYFAITGGVGRWRGSLEYMKPGQGYMLRRTAKSKTTFLYPFYELSGAYIDEKSYTSTYNVSQAKRSTMNLTASVEGIEMQEGDRLIAFADGEPVGSGTYCKTAQDEPLYLSICGDRRLPLWFAIERDGEFIAATTELMTFQANAVIGSPDQPTSISFVQSEEKEGVWYTTSGILLSGRPTQKGVYIFNGKKVLVK